MKIITDDKTYTADAVIFISAYNKYAECILTDVKFLESETKIEVKLSVHEIKQINQQK